MAITTRYYSASGTSYEDCAFLGQRFEEESGCRPEEGECWVCSVQPGDDVTVRTTEGMALSVEKP